MIDILVVGLISLSAIYSFYDYFKAPKAIESQKKDEPILKKKDDNNWQNRLSHGLAKARSEIWGRVFSILKADKLSSEDVERLEEILYGADMSPKIVSELIDILQKKTLNEESPLEFIENFLEGKMEESQRKINQNLLRFDSSDKNLKVVMIVGVNGAGKTTTIGKLATKLKNEGAKVVVGACDTFRAAAVEQLEVWCKRAGVDIIKAHEGADPSGVAYDAVKVARESGADYCIIDTAGRLHTKSNLMEELAKTKRVMSKIDSNAPHEVLLVIDAITGQNALKQAEEFNKALNLTGLIFTKCDGSAKAGSAVSIVDELKVPIAYIGVGEDVEDLNLFELKPYLKALLGTV